jgi:hypothetical protein
MFEADTMGSPFCAVPHTMFVPHTMLVPQTMLVPHTMFEAQTASSQVDEPQAVPHTIF